MNTEIYWEENSNRISNFFTFIVSLFHFFALRSVIMIFLASSLSLAGGLKWFGLFLAILISVFAFSFLSDQFQLIITRCTLKYSIDDEGINFSYWFGKNEKVTIPFESILGIYPVRLKDNFVTNKLYFHLNPLIDVRDYLAFTDDELHMICFDDIQEIELVQEILTDKIKQTDRIDINLRQKEKQKNTEKFSLLLNGVALAYLFLSFFLLLSIIDRFALEAKILEDRVVEIKHLYYEKGGNSYGLRAYTNNGYRFDAIKTSKMPDEPLTLNVSPILNYVTRASKGDSVYFESVNFNGLKEVSTVMCSLLLLFCSVYLVRKGGVIPLQDALFFLIFPIVPLVITYYI